jgi:N-acetylated-alpha-linked acidic dipeptidase
LNRSISALLCAFLILAAPLRARAALTTDEQYVLDQVSAAEAQQDSARINAESHYASTPGDYHVAVWMRDVLAEAGFNATLEQFNHDVPFAKHLELELLDGRKKFTGTKFSLLEAPIAGDPDGSRPDAGVPFNAWSGSGNVYASVVDAGHGTDADYLSLAARHIDPRNRVLLVRYGREFRGLLALRAQKHGAKGVIFFNDPNDGGSQTGPAYPNGPYRPNVSIQRGALGIGQVTIPTLPISADNAAVLLRDMDGGITRHPVHMVVQMTVKRNAPMWNTIGVLPGKDPTHMVVLGAHRDAWVYGVTDNGSGISILLGVARALGNLYKSGWRPQYSIVIAGFDAEEIGELGSEAYVRAHRGALESGCIAYINEDEGTTGTRFGVMAAAAVEDDVFPITQTLLPQSPAPKIEGPGGGSDFESFLYDAGVPVLSYGFEGPFGVYHSAYDDLHYAETEADPNFTHHQTVARLAALSALRFASGSAWYRFSPYVSRMRAALAALGKNAKAGDLTPVAHAIDVFARAAATIDSRGGDGNRELAIDRRLNKLFYGRLGYRALPFPSIASALSSRSKAAVSAAVGRTAHDLNDIASALRNATARR